MLRGKSPHLFPPPNRQASLAEKPIQPPQQGVSVHLAYVDCSNLFIEAKVSAVVRGWARSIAKVNQQGQIDLSYRLDSHRLMTLLRELEDSVQATVFDSVNDSNEGLLPYAEAAGLEVRIVERSICGKEKRVDTGVVTRVCRDAYRRGEPGRDRITLVAGDGGYEPMVRHLVQDGFEVMLLYGSHASRDLYLIMAPRRRVGTDGALMVHQ